MDSRRNRSTLSAAGRWRPVGRSAAVIGIALILAPDAQILAPDAGAPGGRGTPRSQRTALLAAPRGIPEQVSDPPGDTLPNYFFGQIGLARARSSG